VILEIASLDDPTRVHMNQSKRISRLNIFSFFLLLGLLLIPLMGITAETEQVAYRTLPWLKSRTYVWVAAQLHLLFGAFVLAVPMFAVVVEIIGIKTGDKRYDHLAHEFTKLLSTAFSFTASLGAALTFLLMYLYPAFMDRFMGIFGPSFLPYILLFFAEAVFLYSYYYGWGKFNPKTHVCLGIMLNLVGTGIMFIANSWVTFMTSPAGLSESGQLLSLYDAMTNFTWMPINTHRLIANVAFGGSIAAAYAGFKFLMAETDEERAHYDWMGYIGNFIAISAFLILPFAGYWLGKEIYGYSQNLGMTMMGGAFSWLFIIQAELIGILFLGANFYLWLGMGRIGGSEKYQKYIKYLLFLVVICFAVWATPSSLISTIDEARRMGGTRHPILGFLGVMSAKNTAVNILILTTYVSFMLYRRSGKEPIVPWAKTGNNIQMLMFLLAAGFVIFLGVYGYFVEAEVRIGLSVPQVLSVLITMLVNTIIDVKMYKNARQAGEIKWGKISPISQYVLFVLAISFTWLMGLMGYVRSGLRQHWHIYGVMRDTSPDAFTPTLGYATKVVSITVLIFFAMIAVVFWLAGLGSKKNYVKPSTQES